MERGKGLGVAWRFHRWALCHSPAGRGRLCGASRDWTKALGFQPWQKSLRSGLRWPWMGSTSEEPHGGEKRGSSWDDRHCIKFLGPSWDLRGGVQGEGPTGIEFPAILVGWWLKAD